jgi:hypothetical protein
MFQALFAHHQEALQYKTIDIYCTYIIDTNISNVLYAAHLDDEQIVFETCTGC